MTDDPLTVFHDTTEDMDVNEVATLYGILDKNGDEQVTIDRFLFDPSTHTHPFICNPYQVTVDTVVRALMVDMHKNSGETDVAKMRKQEAELVALCKKKIADANGDGSPMMHREAFEANYKNIFSAAASRTWSGLRLAARAFRGKGHSADRHGVAAFGTVAALPPSATRTCRA